jgi:hypothetical protein
MGLMTSPKRGARAQRGPRELDFGQLEMQSRSHAIAPSQGRCKLVDVSTGELLEQRRRRRQPGDRRLTDADRETLDRLVDGDLADEFQPALDAVSSADPPLSHGGDVNQVD